MVSAEVNPDANAIRTGEMKAHDWAKFYAAASILGDANIFIADPGVITVQEIRTRYRRLKENHGLGFIVIDYLQLIQGSGKRKYGTTISLKNVSNRALKR